MINNLNDSKPDYEKILGNISHDQKSGFTLNGMAAVDGEAMVKNYKKCAGKDPKDPNKQNTRSVWFSLTELNQFVKRLNDERAAYQAGDSTKEDGVTDGVRIYFGRYKSPDPNEERNTVLFVSTMCVKGKGHQDYLNNYPIVTEPLNNGELSPPNTFGVSWESEKD